MIGLLWCTLAVQAVVIGWLCVRVRENATDSRERNYDTRRRLGDRINCILAHFGLEEEATPPLVLRPKAGDEIPMGNR